LSLIQLLKAAAAPQMDEEGGFGRKGQMPQTLQMTEEHQERNKSREKFVSDPIAHGGGGLTVG
jgi:hypothetical protein